MQNTSTFHIRAPKSDAPDAKPDDRPAVGSPVGPVWDREGFARALCAWFAQSQRDLPWRHAENARDPYRVLVSEVMLQQTTVAAVIPFYLRFLQRFPPCKYLPPPR
jgi:A/G-specific adenine glycosylase